jgi:hypothetical protein
MRVPIIAARHWRHGLEDRARGIVPYAGAVDTDEARRLGIGETTERRRHFAVKRFVAPADAVVLAPVALGEAVCDNRVATFQQDGHVRHQPIGTDAMEREDGVVVQPPCPALVSARRIDEAIADHPRAAFQRGADKLGDVVGASGGEQQRLGLRAPVAAGRIEQQLADRLGGSGPAGLTGQHDLEAALLQRVGEQARLGRLARPLPAFERDEAAARHQNRPTSPLRRRCHALAVGTSAPATSATS